MVELTNFRMIDSTITLWLDIWPLLLVILTIYGMFNLNILKCNHLKWLLLPILNWLFWPYEMVVIWPKIKGYFNHNEVVITIKNG